MSRERTGPDWDGLGATICLPASLLEPLGHDIRSHYGSLRIRERGKSRLITPPDDTLREVQRKVLKLLRSTFGASDAVHSQPGRSILSNARQHLGRRWVGRFDIRSAFPSLKSGSVRRALRRALEPGVAEAIVRLCVLPEGLPQGAPTSPDLLGLVLAQMDRRLVQASKGRGAIYTRYVDDLIVSCPRRPLWFRPLAIEQLERLGLALNHEKTRWWPPGRPATVTGLLLGNVLEVTPQYKSKVRLLIQALYRGDLPATRGQLASLQGAVAFIESVEPHDGRRLRLRLAPWLNRAF